MKVLPEAELPHGGGKVGEIDFIAMTGDISNRMEGTTQSAAASWNQFAYDYLGLDANGNKIEHPDRGLQSDGSLVKDAPLYLLPGNHDVSNAIGHAKIKVSPDPTVMVQLNNRMLGKNLTNATFNYTVDRVNYSRDIGGVHMMFVNMWPDSGVRDWMAGDLASVSATTPVLVFTHDEPNAEIKHFTDPNNPGGTPSSKLREVARRYASKRNSACCRAPGIGRIPPGPCEHRGLLPRQRQLQPVLPLDTRCGARLARHRYLPRRFADEGQAVGSR